MRPLKQAQIAIRFPGDGSGYAPSSTGITAAPPLTDAEWTHRWDCDEADDGVRHWHIDGMNRGRCGEFSLLVGIFLNHPEIEGGAESGNLVTRAQSLTKVSSRKLSGGMAEEPSHARGASPGVARGPEGVMESPTQPDTTRSQRTDDTPSNERCCVPGALAARSRDSCEQERVHTVCSLFPGEYTLTFVVIRCYSLLFVVIYQSPIGEPRLDQTSRSSWRSVERVLLLRA